MDFHDRNLFTEMEDALHLPGNILRVPELRFSFSQTIWFCFANKNVLQEMQNVHSCRDFTRYSFGVGKGGGSSEVVFVVWYPLTREFSYGSRWLWKETLLSWQDKNTCPFVQVHVYDSATRGSVHFLCAVYWHQIGDHSFRLVDLCIHTQFWVAIVVLEPKCWKED